MADPTVSTVNTNTSNLPDYLQPYITQLAGAAQANYAAPYNPDPNQRVAGFTPAQTQAQSDVAGMTLPGQYGEASGLATTAGLGALSASNYTPGAFNAQTITPQSWNASTASQYMSPYVQDVIDTQQRNAITDAQKTQLTTNLDAARQGTYGGSRQLLADTERERALGQNLSDIEGSGLNTAWNNAQSQFNTDANRGEQAAQGNQSTDLAAQQAAENSRQFSGTLGLQGMDTALKSASTLDTLGNDQQAAQLKLIGAQSAAGQEQQAQQQQQLDVADADWQRQNQYPNTALNTYSGILRGIPAGTNQTSTTTTPAPSTLAQVTGAGLGALSLANLLK